MKKSEENNRYVEKKVYLSSMKKWLIGLAGLFAAALIGQAADLERQTVRYKGETRTYWMYVPEGASQQTPLVLVLHGYGGKAEGYCPQMLEVARREGFAVCYPQGERDHRGNPCWNVGYVFQQDSLKRDDVGFLRFLVSHLRKNYGLSRENAFLTGMSNGGEMCYLMAYLHPGTFNAYAPIAGLTMTWFYKELKVRKPVPMMEVHGTADHTSEWNGDPADEGGWGPYVAVPAAVAVWSAAARCTHEQTVQMPPKGEHPVTLHRYVGGYPAWKGGPDIEVRLYEVRDGKHSWAHQDMDTCAEIWDFFRQYLK